MPGEEEPQRFATPWHGRRRFAKRLCCRSAFVHGLGHSLCPLRVMANHGESLDLDSVHLLVV